MPPPCADTLLARSSWLKTHIFKQKVHIVKIQPKSRRMLTLFREPKGCIAACLVKTAPEEHSVKDNYLRCRSKTKRQRQQDQATVRGDAHLRSPHAWSSSGFQWSGQRRPKLTLLLLNCSSGPFSPNPPPRPTPHMPHSPQTYVTSYVLSCAPCAKPEAPQERLRAAERSRRRQSSALGTRQILRDEFFLLVTG